MNVRRKLAAAVAVACAAAVLGLAGVPAQAAAAHSGHAVFCAAWARFGDTPSYRNLTATHKDAQSAGSRTSSDYRRAESDLLAGRPVSVLRHDAAEVWRDCGK